MGVAFVAGLVLGAFYFWGLWLTVRRLPNARYPYAQLAISFVLRVALVMVGFYLVIRGGNWERGLACLAGFLVARLAVTYHHRPQSKRADKKATDGQP